MREIVRGAQNDIPVFGRENSLSALWVRADQSAVGAINRPLRDGV
ncbi:MAG TPA: hypothetical protein VFQ30_07180 [Ktedonobacteraceae bacterium]|nr:hypothetical protein [Ktedonobacteraceae bacterium]